VGKLAAMLYVISPFSCLSQDEEQSQSETVQGGTIPKRYSAVCSPDNPRENNNKEEKKSALYDLKEKPKVIVFSGHVEANNSGGAVSVTGKREYEYNDFIVKRFDDVESPLEYLTHLATENIEFKKRPEFAEQSGAQVYVEIHHDSVNEKDVASAKTAGKEGQLMYGGFSLHINSQWFYEETHRIGVGIRDCFLNARLQTNTYHAQEDTGIMQAVDDGVYTRSGLYILNNARIPTLIVEAGSIVVPEEEAIMKKRETQEIVVQCIDATLIRYFESK
jgi:N-acetylmuramoyl-L-alanine amidase